MLIYLFTSRQRAATGPTASTIPAESPTKASLNPRPGVYQRVLAFLQDAPLLKAGILEVVTGSLVHLHCPNSGLYQLLSCIQGTLITSHFTLVHYIDGIILIGLNEQEVVMIQTHE